MYIQPNTTVYILRDTRLEPSYEHTFYFNDTIEQYTYFSSKKKYELNQNSYQRIKRGYIRVGIQAENLYDCDYLMFQNISFGSKWFYAFIKSVEYINNEVSEIEFELDVMQTYFFDYQLGECYIEREHSRTDEIGENLVEENIDTGSDIVVNGRSLFEFDNESTMNLCIIMSNIKADDITGNVVGSVYYPFDVLTYKGVNLIPELSSAEEITEFLKTVIKHGEEDRIVSIYEYPDWIGNGSTISNTLKASNTRAFNYTKPTKDTKINGYTPKNNKLYIYPYNFLLATNHNGQTAQYKFENFSGENATFEEFGTFVPFVNTMLYPTSYRGITKDYDSGLSITKYPECLWSGETYSRWNLQNGASTTIGMISSGIGAISSIAGVGVMSGLGASTFSIGMGGYNAGNSIVNSATSIAQSIAKISALEATPPQLHGQLNTSAFNTALAINHYDVWRVTIKKEFAEIIDDYFSRYGYATHTSKVPNRNVRPHWTYTKTIGCEMQYSGIPSNDVTKICSIYNNGITFWKNPDEIGDYSLDNSPTE